MEDKTWTLVKRFAGIAITTLVALLMLTTGTINTVAIKFQDNTKAPGEDPTNHYFHHPFMQSLFMFVGEFLNLFAFGLMWLYGIAHRQWFSSKKSIANANGGYSNANQEDEFGLDSTQVAIDASTESDPILQSNSNSTTTTTTTATTTNNKTTKPMEKEKIPGRWYHTFLFAIPAICDLTATSIMNYGLILTAASVYQMLRSAMVVFTAIFSVIFLRRRLQLNHFVGLALIVVGTGCVGAASMIWKKDENGDDSPSNPVLGDILIVVAQVIVAVQWVLEEKLLSKLNFQPVRAVGAEGLWGLLAVSGLLFIFYWIPGKDAGSFENAIDAFKQIRNSPTILVATVISIFSIALLNLCAMTITSRLSATHRGTIDACRTVCVWVVSLLAGWEKFLVLQAVGFIILVFGTFLYNKVLPLNPLSLCIKKKPDSAASNSKLPPPANPIDEGFQPLETTEDLDRSREATASDAPLKQTPMSYQQTSAASEPGTFSE